MEAKRSPYEDLQALLKEGHLLHEQGKLDEAAETLRAAMALDEHDPKPVEALSAVLRDLGRATEAEALHLRAKAMKKEAWARQVESELRGHHELMGTAVRHEIL